MYKLLLIIGGFVVRKLCKFSKCNVCKSSLLAGKEKPHFTIFTYLKCRGGLITTLKDVIKICKLSECIIREHELSPTFNENVKEKSTNLTLSNLDLQSLFVDLEQYAQEQPPDESYILILTKDIISVYLDIRLNYIARSHNSKVSIRQKIK